MKIFQLKNYKASKEAHFKLIQCLFKAKIGNIFFTSTNEKGERVNIRNFYKPI